MVSANDPAIYFGNRRAAGWVKAPDVGLGASSIGNSDFANYDGGGAFGVASGSTHRRFTMSWSTVQIDDIQFLNDYRNGLNGTGLLYWVDPYASYYNALPPHWADPFLSGQGWPSLTGAGNAPVVQTQTPVNGNSPWNAAYTISGPASAVPDRAATLLIPPTHQLSIGFSGSSVNGAVVRVQPYYLNGTAAPTQDLTLLSSAGPTLMNATFSGATYSYIQVYLTQTTTGTSVLTLSSGDAIYTLLTGTPLLTGIHKRGRGHTGMRFSDDITTTYQFFDDGGVAPRRYVSAATSFTEVGAWL